MNYLHLLFNNVNFLGNRISLTFTAFNLVTSDYCNDDYLEIREDSSNGKLLGTFCGENAPSNITAVSTLWIFFRSNKRDKGESTASGFMADYQYGKTIFIFAKF